ncbi:uncharacterized protein SCHCODRAFT_02495430 [Schizophyllum commune H4-8]|uniref:Expressed protein n=1 Tax=Schizophyllum commune (strain H4-8 / FGSC 9210) TaxID=578458 RepID=D8QI02_SCHCM|nr:uncharacterized protein SCHCODRAFT_02495430 [Schizophyllum commune H4-8]KAI5895903.1 hypothetical protein SCHCODRAFT_02495430 [Schizophyllum commune H4-8]
MYVVAARQRNALVQSSPSDDSLIVGPQQDRPAFAFTTPIMTIMLAAIVALTVRATSLILRRSWVNPPLLSYLRQRVGAQWRCLRPATHAESGLDMVYKTTSMFDNQLPVRFFVNDVDSNTAPYGVVSSLSKVSYEVQPARRWTRRMMPPRPTTSMMLVRAPQRRAHNLVPEAAANKLKSIGGSLKVNV